MCLLQRARAVVTQTSDLVLDFLPPGPYTAPLRPPSSAPALGIQVAKHLADMSLASVRHLR